MNTLQAQRERLQGEVSHAKAQLERLRASEQPNLQDINALMEAVTRNQQLIEMIDNHLGCGHLPMWRTK